MRPWYELDFGGTSRKEVERKEAELHNATIKRLDSIDRQLKTINETLKLLIKTYEGVSF